MLEFVPSQNGTFQFASVNPHYFNSFDSDGVFKKIVSKTADSLAEEISEKLEELSSDVRPQSPAASSSPAAQKRQLTPLYSSTPAKKQKMEESSHMVKGIKERCNKCQLDNKTHFIPVKKFLVPPRSRQIRAVDDRFLEQLIHNMEEQPSGNYEALFVLVKGVQSKDDFRVENIVEYEYEVLGGTHIMLATKNLHDKFPDNPNYQGRVARIYVGLKDEEALWLGAMHNNTGAFCHHLTYKDEVQICRTQLFMPIEDCAGEPPNPTDSWRDMCASLLNKKKRNLSEVFTMAQLSAAGWRHFQTLNSMFENAQLKGQKAKPTEILKKGKPVLKQWQLKPLCSLSSQDQDFLLEKVTQQVMSLEELKSAASEIKSLRPIQEAIVLFFKLDTWEKVKAEFGEDVSPEKLLWFAGKELEQSHDFQKFLERLKRKNSEEGAVEEFEDLLNGRHGSKGLVIFTREISEVQQSDVVKLPHFQGAFLAIGDAGQQCKNVLDVMKLLSRINFLKMTSFNVVLFTSVDDVKAVKEKMKEEGAHESQTAHFFVQNKSCRSESQGPYLRESLKTFVIGHWTVERKLTDRHLSIGVRSSRDNLIILDHANKHSSPRDELPREAYTWLIDHLSREGDTVIDIDGRNGSACVAALKSGRNALWISTASTELHDSLHSGIQNMFSLDSQISENDDSGDS